MFALKIFLKIHPPLLGDTFKLKKISLERTADNSILEKKLSAAAMHLPPSRRKQKMSHFFMQSLPFQREIFLPFAILLPDLAEMFRDRKQMQMLGHIYVQ
jgi:hypothetical protein